MKSSAETFVTFENDGQKICGMLHLPKENSKKCPAVLMCHGFAGNRIGRFRIYVLIARRLAEMGIASLRFDFRGSGESDGTFADMTVSSEVSDAISALQFLRKNSQIDPNRIGILGNSFGAAVAVLTAEKDANIKSLALLAALFNADLWKPLWEKRKSNDETALQQLSKILDEFSLSQNFLQEFFNLHLDQALAKLQKIPLLHIHSEQDDRVSISQAGHYERCRLAAVGETRWIRLQKCKHDFSNTQERDKVIEEVSQWFVKTL